MLVCEPQEDVRSLLQLVVRRLGHEPISYADGGSHGEVDVAIVEPGDPEALRVASGLHAAGVPLVFTSIFPAEDRALELEPAAYLVKPFALSALEQALRDALALPSPS